MWKFLALFSFSIDLRLRSKYMGFGFMKYDPESMRLLFLDTYFEAGPLSFPEDKHRWSVAVPQRAPVTHEARMIDPVTELTGTDEPAPMTAEEQHDRLYPSQCLVGDVTLIGDPLFEPVTADRIAERNGKAVWQNTSPEAAMAIFSNQGHSPEALSLPEPFVPKIEEGDIITVLRPHAKRAVKKAIAKLTPKRSHHKKKA